jgi:hypothetical protein
VSDYAPASGTLHFPPGTTERAVPVAVVGDDLDEEDEETLVLTLDAVSGAVVEDGEGSGAIGDDDDEPSMTIADVLDKEPRTGTDGFGFRVTLSAPSGRTVTVDFQTHNGSAKAPGDFASNAGTLVLEPGRTAGTIGVLVRADNVNEDREQFTVELSDPTNATVADAIGVGKIRDVD